MFYLFSVVIISMLVSALCSILEACLLSISHSDIAEMGTVKPGLAEIWKNFKGNIQKPIAVILIINTLAHTIGASLSGAKFGEIYGPRWIILFSFIFSFAMIQWTEILPKTMGVKYNKKIADIFTIPLSLLIKIFNPVVRLTEFLNMPFVGKKKESGDYNAIKELSVLSRFAFINNLISKDQEQIISRTINLTNIKARDIMIPRRDMKLLTINMTLMEALIEAHMHNHTRFPLLSNTDPNEVLGYINFKDIVSTLRINPANPSLDGIKRPIILFNEEDSFNSIFKKLTHNHQHIAVVKNMNNELTGLITLEDVIEQVIGEIEDEYDVLPTYLYPITNNRYISGGGVTVSRLNEVMNINIPESKLQVNDWIKNQYGAEQKSGNKYQYANIVIIIKKISRSQIKEIIVEKNN